MWEVWVNLFFLYGVWPHYFHLSINFVKFYLQKADLFSYFAYVPTRAINSKLAYRPNHLSSYAQINSLLTTSLAQACSLWGLTPLIDMMIWFSLSTGSNCFIPVPNRLPIPAAMISNVVFISVVLSCLKTYHMFINSLDSLSSLNGVWPQCLFSN